MVTLQGILVAQIWIGFLEEVEKYYGITRIRGGGVFVLKEGGVQRYA